MRGGVSHGRDRADHDAGLVDGHRRAVRREPQELLPVSRHLVPVAQPAEAETRVDVVWRSSRGDVAAARHRGIVAGPRAPVGRSARSRMRAHARPRPRWPTSIADDTQLDDLLSTPSARRHRRHAAARGRPHRARRGRQDGADAGAHGPARLRRGRRDAARDRRRRASPTRRTSRRSKAHGVETIRCDLLDEAAVARLPDAPIVVYMAGRSSARPGSSRSPGR